MAIHIKGNNTMSGCLVNLVSVCFFGVGAYMLFEGNPVIGIVLIVVGVALEKIANALG